MWYIKYIFTPLTEIAQLASIFFMNAIEFEVWWEL